MMDPDSRGGKLLARYEAMKTDRAGWESIWQEIGDYILPRRAEGIQSATVAPSADRESRLFDTTGIHANQVLANGQLAWMSPQDAPWFAYAPQGPRPDDEAVRWCAEVTQIAREELSRSNFYNHVHEFYLDRSGFGTGALHCDSPEGDPLNFRVLPIGSYCIAENAYGVVDTLGRELRMTPRQAAQLFGEENLSEKLRKALQEGSGQQFQKVTFIHMIYPREDAERDAFAPGSINMPIASIYLEQDGGHINRVGGYHAMPVFVSRYLEWSAGLGGLYGYSPSFAALPECRQVNHLQKMLDALAEKMAFPPTMAPEELEGEIDASAGGVTYFSKELAQTLPKEWMTAGRYDIGLDRVRERQNAIRRHFHVDAFQMFAELDKQMTAREVMARENEKLIQVSPTFAKLTVELFEPLLTCVFINLLKAEALPDPPASMIEALSEDRQGVPVPKIEYSSRIALAQKREPTLAFFRALEVAATIVQIKPDVIDNLDWDKGFRSASLADGVSPDLVVKESDVRRRREARARALQAEQERESAMAAADAAAKLGKVPAENPVGRALEGAIDGTAA